MRSSEMPAGAKSPDSSIARFVFTETPSGPIRRRRARPCSVEAEVAGQPQRLADAAHRDAEA